MRSYGSARTRNTQHPRCRVTYWRSTIRSLGNPSSLHSIHTDARLSISDLLKANLPVQSSALITTARVGHFAKMNQMKTWLALQCGTFLPGHGFKQLEVAFGQAWFDGARSIQDKRFKLSWLPLWVVLFWKGMADALEKRSAWQAAAEWVNRWGKEKELLHEADCVHEMMTSLSWGVKVSALGANFPKEQFTRLLSDSWIDGETIDMMMFELSTQAKLILNCLNNDGCNT